MKVRERYQSSDDAYQQLHNTLVELDGDLCHIQREEGWNYAIRRVVKEGKARRWSKRQEYLSIRDMDLNLQQFPLGYVNYMGESYYLTRKPLRKWKQGYYHEYMRLLSNQRPKNQPALKFPVRKRLQPHPQNIFHHQAMVDLYDQNYPSFMRAWVMVSLMDKWSVAWHKHWAFQKVETVKNRRRANDFHLMYKGKNVGRVVDGNVILNHEFRYLTEPFVEAMIHAT